MLFFRVCSIIFDLISGFISICYIFIGVFTKNVQFVNREKCARPYTFVLETSRPAQPGDAESLIMKTNGTETTIQYVSLLSGLSLT